MITAETQIQIHKPADAIFRVVDDFTQAPCWLTSCVELVQVSTGPRANGTLLQYAFDQGGRRSKMSGVLVSYEKGRRIEMKFDDSKFEVSVTLLIDQADGAAFVTHAIAITPKTFLTRLMSPMIRAGNRQQVETNCRRLKELVERIA